MRKILGIIIFLTLFCSFNSKEAYAKEPERLIEEVHVKESTALAQNTFDILINDSTGEVKLVLYVAEKCDIKAYVDGIRVELIDSVEVKSFNGTIYACIFDCGVLSKGYHNLKYSITLCSPPWNTISSSLMFEI